MKAISGSAKSGRRLLSMVAAGLAVAGGASAAQATTITVNTTNTSLSTGTCGSQPCCGIRQAIQAVNTHATVGGCAAGNGSNDTINLTVSGTYTATSSLTISQPVVIHGLGIGTTVLRGNLSSSSDFLILQPLASGLAVRFEDLTVDRTGGASAVTGIHANQSWLKMYRVRVAGFTRSGIVADDTSMEMEDVTIENNSSTSTGGGIRFNNPSIGFINSGIFAHRCTISNNSAATLGGGLYYDGASNTNIYNMTIASNTSSSQGGGVYQTGNANYLFFFNSTIANNVATNSGGGITALFGVKLYNTILGQNAAHTNLDIDGSVNDCNRSLIGDTLGLAFLGDPTGTCGSLLGIPPNLDSTLRDLGSPSHVKVLRPFPGSVVIDAFPPPFDQPPSPPFDPVLTDARKVKRPQFGGSQPGNADIGAFESTRLESEVMTVAAKSSATYTVVSASQFSNGKGGNLQANAINHFVTYSSGASLPTGTYNVKVGFKKASNAGRFQFGMANSAGGSFVSIGAVQDGFASSDTFVTVDLGNVTLGTAGVKFYRFFVTGKNASATSFQVFPDYIDFTRL